MTTERTGKHLRALNAKPNAIVLDSGKGRLGNTVQRSELIVYAPMLEGLPHAESWRCHKCYVKRSQCERGLTASSGARGATPLRIGCSDKLDLC